MPKFPSCGDASMVLWVHIPSVGYCIAQKIICFALDCSSVTVCFHLHVCVSSKDGI